MAARGNGGVMWVRDVGGDEHPGELQSEQKQEVREDRMGRSGRLGRAVWEGGRDGEIK